MSEIDNIICCLWGPYNKARSHVCSVRAFVSHCEPGVCFNFVSVRTHLCLGRGGETAETGSVQKWEWEEAAAGEAHRSGEGKILGSRYFYHLLWTAPCTYLSTDQGSFVYKSKDSDLRGIIVLQYKIQTGVIGTVACKILETGLLVSPFGQFYSL